MHKVVGYMEGTDPVWLTILQARGFGTIPLSNGVDCHGMNIRLLTKDNRPDLIICYLHKLIAPRGEDVPPEELLLQAHLFDVPVLIACPEELHAAAVGLLGVSYGNMELVDPGQMLQRAGKLLG